MKLYEVTYWREGPGRSDYETVLVCAKTATEAKAVTIETQGVYKSDLDTVSAKRVKVVPQVIRYVEKSK